MTDTEEDQFFSVITPKDNQRCTRQTGCKRAEYLICNEPGTGTHHVRDVYQELETTPPPKQTTRPPAPPDHTIFFLSADFQQAFLDNDLEEIQILLNQFDLYQKTSLDLLKYDHTKLTNNVKTALKLIKPQSQLPPALTTQPLLHPFNPQTVSIKLPRAELTKWTRLSYNFFPWI